MLTQDTKKHIDAARQILVGVVPNPMSQVEQITNALIYKFMDDMDQQAIKAGGDPSFFVKDLEKYAWTKVMDSRLGNQERMNIYTEALMKFSEAKQLPQLFRDIFKQAFLPYRDPEVLGLFLKEISYFDYTHSEELGNAYEYLLSIMSSQGDAGQFRTPRHIIDFIVDVLAPTKDDTILDPACGTAGFLISAYNYIKRQNEGVDPETGKMRQLTADERRKLVNNFEGYDVDPTMVRMSQVNMYLHKFTTPKIYNYNTLASEDRWNDKFDLILANPPFMSPKGGIKPHNKFSVQANRAEVLFVDYITNHLKPKGRAGIIVPEGIIFQSGKAYKELRKNLVNDGLFAVVSLPAGVFNPYSGVKTSILFFDNEVAKKTKDLLFVKVTNDGYDLGAQRRKIEKDDLGDAGVILKGFRTYVINGENQETIESYINGSGKGFIVSKEKISETGDYNLSADRYKVIELKNEKYPIVELGDVANISSGDSAPQEPDLFKDGTFPFFRTSDVGNVHLSDNLISTRDYLNEEGVKRLKLFKKGTILFPKSGASTFLNHRVMMGVDGYVSSHLATIKANNEKVLDKFIYYLLVKIDAKSLTPDQAYPSLKISDVSKIKIPLPPLDVQKEIVEQIEVKQKILDGAKAVVENWKPDFKISKDWPKVKLGEVCAYQGGTQPPKSTFMYEPKEGYIRLLQIRDYKSDNNAAYIPINTRHNKCVESDIMIGRYGPPVFQILRGKAGAFNVALMKCLPDNSKITNDWLFYFLSSEPVQKKIISLSDRVRQSGVRPSDLDELLIPVPSMEIQNNILIEILEQEKIIQSNKKLIEIIEEKISEILSEI